MINFQIDRSNSSIIVENEVELPKNNIDRILTNSIIRFYQTGMEQLAVKWEKILLNYRRSYRKSKN